MKDRTIINTISNIYFIITSLLIFIFISFSILFITLQNGLYINSISMPNLKIKQLYIKWNENLDLSIKEIKIKNNESQTNSETDFNTIASYLDKLPHFYNIFEKISITKISFNDIDASFKYEKGENGYFVASSPDFKLNSSIYFEEGLLNIQLNDYTDLQRDVEASGNIILNPKNNTLTSSIIVDVNNEISLNILLHSNENKLHYKVISLKEISSITYLMEELNLHDDIKYWAYEAITFSSLSLHDVYGWIDFNDVSNAYKNIYASATGHKLSYAYNKNLDSIHTKTTELEFRDGVLYIYPKQATTYKSKLGTSWLKIDFTTKEELLTLKLLFDGKLNKDTLGILEEFKIKIPFLQNTGKTKVDLTLKVNLRTIAIDAQGDFFTRVANFRYHGFDIDVFNANIQLDNYNVKIENMLAKYENLITTKVDVVYDAKTSNGVVDFDISDINIKKANLRLNQQSTLKAKYKISPNNDTISVNKSFWNFYNHKITINNLTLPFDLKTLQINIPKTQVLSKTLANIDVSGFIDLNKLKTNLDINLKKIYFGDIILAKNKNLITVKYDKKLVISTHKITYFTLNDEKSFLNPTTIVMQKNKLFLDNTYINIGNMLKTKLYGEYNLKSNEGYLETRRLRFYTKELGLLYFNKETTKFDIKYDKKKLNIASKELEIFYTDTHDIWSVHLKSLHLLSLRSDFMKKYHINDGSILLSKKYTNKNIDVLVRLQYPYAVMVKNDTPIKDYTLQGQFNTSSNALSATINNDIQLNIDKSVNLSLNNVGININAVNSLIQSLDDNKPKTHNDIQVFMDAHNSYIYLSKNRRAISEHMYLYYENHILTAGLLHGEGSSGLKYEDEKFNAFGEDFNDEFMEELFAFSDFSGGKFEFNLSGNIQKYEGIFTVDNTIILDYKLLNNVLAFVNTIPALVTFSTPGYNSKGLHLQTAYMKFMSQDDVFDISDIYFHSKELDILGKGTANYKKNEIDLSLQLKTDIGSSVAKVPVLGYLFLDGDSLSTTLSVKSPLSDPSISTLIGKEIVVAPLNLLLRTLTLPYYLITKDDTNTSKEE